MNLEDSNVQCECGLCCGTMSDWYKHRESTGHMKFNTVTIESLKQSAMRAIRGLETFHKEKRTDICIINESMIKRLRARQSIESVTDEAKN